MKLRRKRSPTFVKTNDGKKIILLHQWNYKLDDISRLTPFQYETLIKLKEEEQNIIWAGYNSNAGLNSSSISDNQNYEEDEDDRRRRQIEAELKLKGIDIYGTGSETHN